MDLIESNKGKNSNLCFEGYVYNFHKQCSAHIRWRCNRYSSYKIGVLCKIGEILTYSGLIGQLQCKGIATTTLNYEEPSLKVCHNHAADTDGVEATKCVQQMKRRIQDSLAKPSQIFAEEICKIPDRIKGRLPNEDVVKRSLRNKKQGQNPGNPPSLCDLVIEGPWASTGEPNNERFLLCDNGQDAEERVIIFATDRLLNCISAATTWFLEECHIRNMYPDPTIIYMDFEKAAINAAKTVLGEHVEIRGCFYHLCQSTHRKIQELGLEILYRSDDNFNTLVGMLDGLAFLPVEQVKAGMFLIKSLQWTRPYTEMLDYFDNTYVNGTFRRVGGNDGNIRLRNIPPQFPPEMWNVHQATMLGEERTNNSTEGWNNRFSNLVGLKHPSIWILISKMRQEVAVDCTKLERLLVNPAPKPKKQKTYVRLNNILKQLCQEYTSNIRNDENFLLAISHNIRYRPSE